MGNPPFLIFGGSGGVGSALAQRLVAGGQQVVLVARNANRLREQADALGGVPYAVCDVRDTASVAATVGKLAGSNGLAGIAYCVGSIVLKPLKRATESDFHDALALNAIGAALVVQAAEVALRREKGAVVLFSTVAAQTGFPNHAIIGMAKGAVEALTRSLAAELAPDVRVNCIAPSLMRTSLARSLTANEAVVAAVANLHAIPRLGEADDAAALAAFLLGPEAGWITGQVIAVDGGRSRLRVKG